MAQKRHGQSKEKYSVILLDILPNSIQIAISKDFAEDLTSKTSVLTGYTTRSKLRKIIRWQIALCYFKCLREPFTMICTVLQLPTEQFFIFLLSIFVFSFSLSPCLLLQWLVRIADLFRGQSGTSQQQLKRNQHQ